jgi:uncharacterized protein (UPF0332 family)
MTPEIAAYLRKARSILSQGEIAFGVGLFDIAGRSAYLAAFHAAQAMLFEKIGRAFKTHHGVQNEFHRLIRGDSNWDDELRGFLSRGYDLKSIADYETGENISRPPEEIAEAIATAKRFIAKAEAILADAPETPPQA